MKAKKSWIKNLSTPGNVEPQHRKGHEMKQRMSVLLLLLAVACGGSANTGSVTGAALSEGGQIVAVVKMDDGREVQAVMPAGSGGSVTLVGGQRVQLEPMPDSKLWRVVRTLDSEKAMAGSAPAAPFEVVVTSSTKQQEWAPDAVAGIVLTRGASFKLVDGAMSGFEAEPGYEIAVVSLEIAINAADASLPLDKAVGLDAAGTEYGNLGTPAPLGKGKGQRRQLGFAVPAGTVLAAVRLSNGYTVKLAGK
jgi:hypothetical protein